MQVLLVRPLHLSVLSLNVPLRHLVVANVIVNLVVNRLLYYIPVGVSLR